MLNRSLIVALDRLQPLDDTQKYWELRYTSIYGIAERLNITWAEVWVRLYLSWTSG